MNEQADFLLIELEEKNLITYSDFNHLNIRRTDG